MEASYSLIHNLTSAEWSAFQNYLSCFTTYESAHLKQLNLAEMLNEAQECPTYSECCIKFYGRKRDSGFKKLKSRLKEKLQDFLLSDISPDKKNELDEADYAMVKIKKKSALYQQLLYSKTRNDFSYELLDEIIGLGKKYEHYSFLVDHLRLKKGSLDWKTGTVAFENISKEIEKYWDYHRMLYQAEHYYYQMLMLGQFSSKPDNKKVSSFFRKSIPELERYNRKMNSPLIKYYLAFLQLGLHHHCKDFMKARSTCLALLEIIRNNKSVYRKQRISIMYDHLSRYEFYLGRYKQAAEWAREAQKNFNPGSENYCIALEQEFYALFAMKKYKIAIEIANQMLASASRKELGEFRLSQYNYLLANTLFKENRFTEALRLLSKIRGFSEDKPGWETGVRFLSIMTLVEMNKTEDASLAVRSLKQFFKRIQKKIPICPRDKKILNLLLIAERESFNFRRLRNNINKYMKALSAPNDAPTGWKPFTHEVIPFHEWFADKMNGKAIQKKTLTSVPDLNSVIETVPA